MRDIVAEADRAAQEAFRTALGCALRTGKWDPYLERQYLVAEQLASDVRDAEWMPEALLDALHEATHLDIDDLTAAELAALPDVPLAWSSITESELRLMDGNR